MAQRLLLHDLLTTIADHVYFQPKTNTKIVYPCIVYELDGAADEFADNLKYQYTWRYSVTVIDRDPDSALKDLIMDLPMCTFNRYFPSEGLNHTVFNLYF